MCHGMSDTETYIGEAHTGNVLTQSHAFTAFLGIGYSAAQGLGNNLNGLQVEHVSHFPCRLGGVTLNCVSQSVHASRGGQAFRHGGHHIRVYNCDDGHIMRVYAYEFTFSFYVGDNVVDGNLCSSTGCSRNGDDRDTRIFGRCGALQASDILKLRVCDDDTDALEVSIEEPPPMAIR